MAGPMSVDENINSIIFEYLEHKNYHGCANLLQTEIRDAGLEVPPVPLQNSQRRRQVQSDLEEAFEKVAQKQFFDLWHRNVPTEVNDDLATQKLEFYLQLYFAIRPLKDGREESTGNMLRFRTYIETAGSVLCKTPEFLPFYALPFVPDPRSHPSYEHIFSDTWNENLRVKLSNFLQMKLGKSLPRIYRIIKASDSTGNESLLHKVTECENKILSHVEREKKIQSEYRNLISITADLVDTLEASVQGKPISPTYLQQVCARLFSSQVRESVDLTRPGTAAEIMRQSVTSHRPASYTVKTASATLDYSKMKTDLVEGSCRTKLLLLQSLRWKLTKSSTKQRQAVLEEFCKNDLLGCLANNEYTISVLKLFSSDEEAIRQYTGRFFNAFASLSQGRRYLLKCPLLLESLIENLKFETKDSQTRENVLGCLQKMSLRRQSQNEMIERDVIQWLIDILKDFDSLSEYTLEYAAALLMNLCLRTAGKGKCSKFPRRILTVLGSLLGNENSEISPYINGTLYSILSVPNIRKEALSMDLQSTIEEFMKTSDPDSSRQLGFIVKQLMGKVKSDADNSEDEDDEDDEEDQEVLEADLDKHEIVKDELSGDQLLNAHYLLIRKTKVNGSSQNVHSIPNRPMTPSQQRGNSSCSLAPRSASGADILLVDSKGSDHAYQLTANGRPNSRNSANGRPNSRNSANGRPNSRKSANGRTNSRDSANGRPNSRNSANGRLNSRDSANGQPSSRDSVQPVGKEETFQRMVNSSKTAKPTAKSNDEISQVFGARPKIPRTPDLSKPSYSNSLPQSRPSSSGHT